MKIFVWIAVFTSFLFAHSVTHEFQAGGMAFKLLMGDKPASFAPYTLYAPNASLPYQEGQSDKNGIVAFVPDRAGKWKLVATPGSDHGGHIFNIEFDVNADKVVTWDSAPIYAKYAQIITGLSLIFGFFGFWMAFKRRKA